MLSDCVESPIGSEASAAFADLRLWLPSVLDDAVLRDALLAVLHRTAFSPSCAVAAMVYAAITGRPAPVRLTSAIWLLYLGVELCDDVADGDIDGGARAEAQATLLAGVLLASLAPAALAAALAESNTLTGLRYLWRGLQAMCGGQRRDLALYGATDADPREVEAALAKSTAECGMYAAIGACAAGVRDAALDDWERFGARLGYALEVNADCRDVLDPCGRDIRNGARTLPIVLALSEGAYGDRDQARRDIAAAPADAAACARARNAVALSGSVIACGALVEAAVAGAERILDMLAPPHDTALRAFVRESSLLRLP